MSVRQQIREQQQQAAVEFGQMLRRWRIANGWTQYTSGEFAATAEPPMDAPSHSGASEIENAKITQPRNAYFLFLGELNQRIADQDWKGVTKRKLLDQLKGSRAITDEHGRPWGAAQFWSCHAGILSAPDWLAGDPEQLAPQLSDDEALALGVQWKAQVLQLGVATGMSRTKALGSFVASVPSSKRQVMEQVLLDDFTATDLAQLWDPAAGEWLPLAWIARWSDEIGSPSGGGLIVMSSQMTRQTP